MQPAVSPLAPCFPLLPCILVFLEGAQAADLITTSKFHRNQKRPALVGDLAAKSRTWKSSKNMHMCSRNKPILDKRHPSTCANVFGAIFLKCIHVCKNKLLMEIRPGETTERYQSPLFLPLRHVARLFVMAKERLRPNGSRQL